MRKYNIVLILLQSSLLCPTISGQNTYWVSNDPSDAEIVQFTNLQTAIDSAENGDILYVYSSEFSYGSINLNKSLIIEGIGYQLNHILQPSLDITTVNYQPSINSINITDASDVIIKSIYLANLTVFNCVNLTFDATFIYAGAFDDSENVVIINCYVGSGLHSAPNVGQFNIRFLNTHGIIISNSIFSHYNPEATLNNLLISGDCGNIIVTNCIFNDIVLMHSTQFINNIHYIGGIEHTNCTITNNITTGTYNGNPPGNLYNVIPSSIFVGLPTQGSYSFDSRYQLLPDSPARDYGVNGVDCGVFDGDFPYRLSGITNRPIVSELVVPTGTYNDQMEITVRVKIID